MNHRMACTAAAAALVVVVLALVAAPSPASAAGEKPKRKYYNPKYKPSQPFPAGISFDDRLNMSSISRKPNRFDYVEPDDKDLRITMCWAYLGHMWVIREIKEWFIHRKNPSDLTCEGIMHTHKDCFPDMFFIFPFVKVQNALNLLKHCHVYHKYQGEATPGWHGPRQPSGKVLPVPPRGKNP